MSRKTFEVTWKVVPFALPNWSSFLNVRIDISHQYSHLILYTTATWYLTKALSGSIPKRYPRKTSPSFRLVFATRSKPLWEESLRVVPNRWAMVHDKYIGMYNSSFRNHSSCQLDVLHAFTRDTTLSWRMHTQCLAMKRVLISLFARFWHWNLRVYYLLDNHVNVSHLWALFTGGIYNLIPVS